MAVIAALAITILLKIGPAHYSAAVFSPASTPHGQLTDITNAMIYGITAFAGFEAAAALGEEARNVSTRKSCERARRNSAWRSLAATPVAVLLVRGFAVRRWLGPGAEVLGAGVPGQGPGECLAGQGLSAVAAAFVEVGGQVGNGVQSGQLGSREDGPDVGGGPGGARVLGAASVLPGHDRAADRSLGQVIVVMPTSA
jgi:amino acid transporter